jgi:hypothetical protein
MPTLSDTQAHVLTEAAQQLVWGLCDPRRMYSPALYIPAHWRRTVKALVRRGLLAECGSGWALTPAGLEYTMPLIRQLADDQRDLAQKDAARRWQDNGQFNAGAQRDQQHRLEGLTTLAYILGVAGLTLGPRRVEA